MSCRSVLAFTVALVLSGVRPAPLSADDLLPAFPQPQFDGASPCAVSNIADATHLVVQCASQELRLELLGVAAPPEASRPAARDALARMLLGEFVYVQYEQAAAGKTAPAYVWRAPDGLFVNLELVRAGYARAGSRPDHVHRDLFRHYEDVARRFAKGVWNPDAPAGGATARSLVRPAGREPPPQLRAGDTVVYVTRTGRKYHRQDCPHASKSGRPIALREAGKRYGPCSRCDPPLLND